MKLATLIKNQLWEFKDRKGRVKFAIERTGAKSIALTASDSTVRGRAGFIEADEVESVTEVKEAIKAITNRRRRQIAKEAKCRCVSDSASPASNRTGSRPSKAQQTGR